MCLTVCRILCYAGRGRPTRPTKGAPVANFDELAQQGDPGTLATEAQALKIKLKTPQELYELWERQHWLSQDIDFSKDIEDYAGLSDEQKDMLLWNLSSFFVGEERVTTQFSGLVMAYDDEQEEAFLATQQVDEARHVQHFDRFYREVVGLHEENISDRIQHVREHLNDAFKVLFDESLVQAGNALIQNPRDRGAKVDFMTIYHMVIEGVLALTGQNFITEYLETEDILPGFLEGFKKISQDEHRHVAYGTWYLKQSAGQDEALADRMRAKLQELIPIAAGVFVPPGHDPSEPWEILGYHSDVVNEFAFNALTRRLKAIGVPLMAPEPVAA
jgi:ribonucleoside-diphosphate reductase beta chain